jgi:hypothetical protein
MRAGTIVGPVLVAAVLAGIGILFTRTGEGMEELIELAVITLVALLLAGALYDRGAPRAPRRRTFRRTPDSRW